MEAPHQEASRDRPPASHRTSAVPEEAARPQPVRAGDSEGRAERSSDDALPKAANGTAPAEPSRSSGPAAGGGPAVGSGLAAGGEPAAGGGPAVGSGPAATIEEAPPSVPREVPTPLLASEALMEDLAPMHPARDAARVWCAVVGLSFLLLGGLSLAGLRPGGAAAGPPAFVLGFVALVAAFTPVSYRQRAIAMVVLGMIATVIGLRGAGPAVGIDAGSLGWGAARAAAAMALPAALVFRSRYRAYAGARWLLLAAFLIALPSLGHAIARLVLLDLQLGHVGAFLVILTILASLTGFMGAETTGAGTFLAVAVVLACSIDLLLGELAQMSAFSVPGIVNALATALAFAATCAITSLGLFQILAWRLAADARRIDLHSHRKDTDARDRLHSGGEWLS